MAGLAFVAGLALGVPCRAAQGLVPLAPFEYVADVYVTDSTLDKLFHLADLNLDGDFNDAGETVVFYDDTVGSLPLSNNSSLALGKGNMLYVSDRSTGWILSFLDADGDGKAESPGEHLVYFDGNPLVNRSGLDVVAPHNVTVDANNVLWVAEADQGGLGTDSVLRLEDLNFDGDANDPGEAQRYFQPAMGSVEGDTIVADVVVSSDGFLYYVEGSTTGFRPVGLYRLDDANQDGQIDPMTEALPFFLVPSQPSPVFLQAGALDGLGYLYLTDTGNEVVWRVRDENNDGSVNPATEAKWYLVSPVSALIWDLAPTADGRVLCTEVQTSARLLELDDKNGDGSIDLLTELSAPYSALLAPVKIQNPRGLAWEPEPLLSIPSPLGIGQTGTGSLASTTGDIAGVYYSTGSIAPLPLPGLGLLEIDLTPGAVWGLLTLGVVPSLVPMSFPVPVPGNPVLVGLQLYLQGFAGKPDRFLLTQVATLMVQ